MTWWAILIVVIIAFVLLLCLTYAIWRARTRAALPNLRGLHVDQDIKQSELNGQWHEVGRLDSWFEPKGLKHVTADYKPNKDGTIRVANKGILDTTHHKVAHGVAWLTSQTGVLQVSFFPFVQAPYVVLNVNRTPQTSRISNLVIGSPSRKYLWALSRTKPVTEESAIQILTEAKNVASKNNYSQDKLKHFRFVS